MAKSLVLNRSRKVPAEDTAAFGSIAERFRRAGALERAVELCREGLQKFPDHISARVTLGWSLLDLGKYDDARVELEQVLRRAPDNLAAIRGLAELHDRFEHTLHLPMDGPGQWPPTPESIDATRPESSATAEHDAGADLEMTPAALGIPIWSPPVSPAPAAEAPLTHVVSVAAPVAAPTAAASTMAAATVAPVARAFSEPATAEPSAPGSGMSSVRDIDFATTASVSVQAQAAEEPSIGASETREARAEATELSEDAHAVSDADIQALIAEAESLDDADATPSESETVSLGAMALGTQDPLSDVAEMAAPAMSYSSVTEPISVDLDLNAAPAGIAESLAVDETVNAEAAAALASVEMSETEVFEAALEIAAPIVDAALEIEEPGLGSALVNEEPALEAALANEEPALEAALGIEPGLESELVVEEPVMAACAAVELPVESPAMSQAGAEAIELSAQVIEQNLNAVPVGIAESLVVDEAVSAEAAAAFAPVEMSETEVFEAALEIAAPIVDAALEIQIQEPAFEAALVNQEPAFEAALVNEEPAFESVSLVEDPPVAAYAPVELPIESLGVAQAEPEPIELSAPVIEQPAAASKPVMDAPEPQPELVAEVPAREQDLATETELASEIDVAPAIEALAAAAVVELAPVAAVAVAEVVSIEEGRTPSRSPVPALERFLTKVQARRAQLMAESVA